EPVANGYAFTRRRTHARLETRLEPPDSRARLRVERVDGRRRREEHQAVMNERHRSRASRRVELLRRPCRSELRDVLSRDLIERRMPRVAPVATYSGPLLVRETPRIIARLHMDVSGEKQN